MKLYTQHRGDNVIQVPMKINYKEKKRDGAAVIGCSIWQLHMREKGMLNMISTGTKLHERMCIAEYMLR